MPNAPVPAAASGLPAIIPDRPIDALRLGLDNHVRSPGAALDLSAQMDRERDRIRALRRAIAERIEADLALLDALDGDPDLEEGGDLEPSLCGVEGRGLSSALQPSSLGGDDREDGDDTGIGDIGGLAEQRWRHLASWVDDGPSQGARGLRLVPGGRR